MRPRRVYTAHVVLPVLGCENGASGGGVLGGKETGGRLTWAVGQAMVVETTHFGYIKAIIIINSLERHCPSGCDAGEAPQNPLGSPSCRWAQQ